VSVWVCRFTNTANPAGRFLVFRCNFMWLSVYLGDIDSIKAAYATTGLTAILTQKFSILKGFVALFLILLSSATVFLSPNVSRTNKLFFFGICILILTFGIGVIWLRGDALLLAPRYAYVFSLFWVAIVWILGGSLISSKKQSTNSRTQSSWLGSVCTGISGLILMIFICLSIFSIKTGLDHNGSLRQYYAPRINVALYIPLNELDPDALKKSIRCNRSSDVCMENLLRMRCFANNVRENVCSAGTADDMRKAIDSLKLK